MPKAACYLSTRCVRLLIVQLLACGLTVSAATARSEASKGILDGDVADAIEGAPISSAFVLIHRGGGSGIRWCGLNLQENSRSSPPGRYDIFVAADGFVPTCKVVEIVSDQTTQFSQGYEPTSNMRTEFALMRRGPSQQNSAQLTIMEGSAFIDGENQTWLRRRRPTEWKFSKPGSGWIRWIMFCRRAARSGPDACCSNSRCTPVAPPA